MQALLGAGLALLTAIAGYWGDTLSAAFGQFALGSYGVIALSRGSRWPLAITVLAYGGGALAAALGRGPLFQLGLAEAGVLALLILPHWRWLNWKPLGIEPPDRPPIEDLFD